MTSQFCKLYSALQAKNKEIKDQQAKQYPKAGGYNGRYAKKAKKLYGEYNYLEKEFMKEAFKLAREMKKCL